ncbi:glycosyltransferase [Rhodopseudomonas sp. AAP120]|uniref:glycosyltransferase n=1 Tax=Rhodopseudomonas sp. AAP120 TaxID=1523430 RepID=UPI0006B896AA|nr:glycosyltransferase [Rhodopseudomonas sp. AAP120]
MVVVDLVQPSDAPALAGGEARRSADRSERPPFLHRWDGDPAAPVADQPPEPEQSSAIELDCLRGLLAPAVQQSAERRAQQLGIGADQVLIRWGLIGEATYLDRLARHLGIACLDFATLERRDIALSDDQMRFAATAGVLPLWQQGELVSAIAPRRVGARTLCETLQRDPSLGDRFRLATESELQAFLERSSSGLARHACSGLAHLDASLSAAPAAGEPRWRSVLKRAAGAALLICALPLLADLAWGIVPALLFLLFIGLRLLASAQPLPAPPAAPRWPDAELPIYTAIAALYREASSVAALVEAIEALDYPREKLDIILVVEPDDLPTRAAIARLRRGPHLRVLVAPADAPQTKPKALNYALPFVRGSMVTVFDAEDRPAPDQLRAALAAFAAGGPQIGCVQASLQVDNTAHSWLSRLFLAEYAGQFEAVLPGLSRLGLPLPLGGSSNHFSTRVLRAVGGWDAHNVTEDADLGFRLARFGYGSISFASHTCEEAPIGFAAWWGQRTRWMKGWMQTWWVHMRRPAEFWRDAGWRGLLTLNLYVGGGVVSALMHPLLLLHLVLTGATLARSGTGFSSEPSAWLHGLTIAAGYLGSALVAAIGLRRIGRLRDAVWLLAMPLYWIGLSLAAWRALHELVWKPQHWQKTEHGIAARASSPAEAERGRGPTGTASDPPRPLRASA